MAPEGLSVSESLAVLGPGLKVRLVGVHLRVEAVDWPGLGLVTSATGQLGGERRLARTDLELASTAALLARLPVLEPSMVVETAESRTSYSCVQTDRPVLSHCLTGPHSSSRTHNKKLRPDQQNRGKPSQASLTQIFKS